MADFRLDPDVVSDAEPDTANADSDVQRPTEHPDQQQLTQKMRIWLTKELKEQHADLLIIFAEDDRPDAIKLQKVVNALEFQLETGQRIRAKALLQNEAVVWVTSLVDWLGYAMEYSTLFCFLFTDKFIRDPPLQEIAKASFWETVTNRRQQDRFIPVYPYVQNFPQNTLSPYFKQLMPLRMYKDGWEEHVSKTIDFCLNSRLEREEYQRKEQIDYIDRLKKSSNSTILDGLSGLRISAESGADHGADIVHQTNTSCTATRGGDSERNLDAHANEQHLANADNVDSASRPEPDGSCDTEAAAAAVGGACSVVSPAKAACKSDDKHIELSEVLLFAATVGITVLTFFHRKRT